MLVMLSNSPVILLFAFSLFGLGGPAVRNAPDDLRSGQIPAASSQNKEALNPARNFEVQKIAEGVYAVVRKDLPGLMVDANNVFIINDDDVIVVDANGAPSITKEVLAALRKLTNKPVRYVINTHW